MQSGNGLALVLANYYHKYFWLVIIEKAGKKHFGCEDEIRVPQFWPEQDIPADLLLSG